MDPYLVSLFWICGGIGAIIALLLTLTCFVRVTSVRQERRYQHAARAWEETLLTCLESDDVGGCRLSPEGSYLWMWRFLLPYLEAVRGEEFDRIVGLADRSGMQRYFMGRLAAGSSFERARAARVLTALGHRQALPLVLSLLRSRRPAFVICAARGVAALGAPAYLFRVGRWLLTRTYITFEGATQILVGFGERSCGFIHSLLADEARALPRLPGRTADPDSIREALLIMSIGVLAEYRYTQAAETLVRLSNAGVSDETTIHILKALVRMDLSPAGLRLCHLLRHPHWVVRSFAARLWGIEGHEELAPAVERLLNDPNYWVRHHASRALAAAVVTIPAAPEQPSGAGGHNNVHTERLAAVGRDGVPPREAAAAGHGGRAESADIAIARAVIGAIAAMAAMECGGVVSMAGRWPDRIAALLGRPNLSRGADVRVKDGVIVVTLHVIVSHRSPVLAVVDRVAASVSNALQKHTGQRGARVNVHVVGLWLGS